MAEKSSEAFHLEAEVISVKGDCHTGHKVGDRLRVDCYDSGGLCGFFYHDIFPSLSVMHFNGRYPWGSGEDLTLECPDRGNAVTIKLRKVRE